MDSRNKITVGIFCFEIVFLLLLLILFPIIQNFNEQTYTITITDKERVNDNDSSKYLVFGKDPSGEIMVFENTDTLLRGKFDSSTVYGNLEIGKTYEITVVGFRVPFLSWYQNIISYSEKS